MESAPIIKEVIVHASVSNVWQAITEKEKMKLWYFDIAEFKPEVGFEFQFVAENEEKKKFVHLCKITEVVYQKKLSYSWQYEGIDVVTHVTFELSDEGNNKTKVRLTHEGVDKFPANLTDYAKQNFIDGWDQLIGTSLKNYVEKN